MRDTFLSYKNYRFLWLSLVALFVMSLVYWIDNPVGGRNGGTLVGYTYGVLATAGIAFLMWFGIRKRAFYAKRTTLIGTLSAHVWLGIALLFVVPLHCGFSFGLNVHTLAYVLMVITILSGIWGVIMYAKVPGAIHSQRGGGTLVQLLEQIKAISSDINSMAGIDSKKEAEPKSDAFLKMLARIDFTYKPSLLRGLLGRNPKEINRKRSADLLGKLPRSEQEEGLKLIGLVNKKRMLVCRIQEETQALTWVRLWLFFHLPISFGLCAAVLIHIFSVFFYW